jgi:AmmeMemoRadiSam system protein B
VVDRSEAAVMSQPIRIRPAAVAGLFYPAAPAALRAQVGELLAEAGRRAAGAGHTPLAGNGIGIPKAIIAPHAGYTYSGPIAASAFAALAPGIPTCPTAAPAASAAPAGGHQPKGAAAGAAAAVRRVVLLGPSHRVAFRGLALPDSETFSTPLGQVPLDFNAIADVARLPQVLVRPDAHSAEHSLEVELPFLQVLLGEFQLVPLVVGDAEPEDVAEVLDLLWGGADTLVVVSSDLSHYLPAAAAERADRATAARIGALGGPLDPREACGAMPINGLLAAARRRGLVPRLLDLRHSGDTSGDRSRVVGYGAWAFDQHAA